VKDVADLTLYFFQTQICNIYLFTKLQHKKIITSQNPRHTYTHAFIINENFSSDKFFSTVALRIFHMSGFMIAVTNILSEHYYYWSPRSSALHIRSTPRHTKVNTIVSL